MPAVPNITVFSWSDPHLDGIEPAVRVDHGANPTAAADAAIAKLRARPPGLKAILNANPLVVDVPTNRNVFTIANSVDAIVAALRAGPDIAIPLKWTQAFYRRLHSAGVTPDWLVCDEETGWNYWQIPLLGGPRNAAVFQKILTDPLIRAKMPADVRTLVPSDFSPHARHYRRAVLAWCHWTDTIKAAALRDAVLNSATDIFGLTPRASNFGDLHPAFQLYDPNGWEIAPNTSANTSPDAATLSAWSSPGIYLVPGNRHNVGRQKHPCWNIFLDNLNAIRSCIAGDSSPSSDPAPRVAPQVAPWISHPSYAGDQPNPHRLPHAMRWLWTEQLRHVHATGITTLLYWNPAETKVLDARSDDQFAAELFTDLRARPTSKKSLPPLPLDANQVISGNYITTYEEFKKNFPPE